MYTGYKDHTGAQLNVGDECLMDSGHSHGDDEKGKIIYKQGNGYYFMYEFNNDEVPLGHVHKDLEKTNDHTTELADIKTPDKLGRCTKLVGLNAK